MPELIENLNWAIDQARAATSKQVLIVVEDVDKIDPDAALEIFKGHSTTLTTQIKAAMIYTLPTALRYSYDFNIIRQSFNKVCSLPNIATHHPDKSPIPEGIDTLRNLVLARVEENLIDTDAMILLLQSCGGIPSQLIVMVRDAALYASAVRNTAQITTEDVNYVIKDLRDNFLRPALSEQDIVMLRKRHQTHQLTKEPSEESLLYNGSLIDYGNGEPWCDANPVLWPLLENGDGNTQSSTSEED